MRAIIAFALAAGLAGCVQHSAMTCVPVPEYTKAEQNRAADELEALPADVVMIPRLIGDYRVMRAQARRCL